MTPPTWSQVPARAAGLRATKAAKRPPRATDQMIKHVRAFPFRSDRLDNPRPPEVESAERIRRTTTGGHVARAIRGFFTLTETFFEPLSSSAIRWPHA